MANRILLLTSHSIAEYDDLRMLTDLGYEVFSIGAYTDPQHPTDDKRPALDAPAHPEFAALCDRQRQLHSEQPADWAIDWAKADLHPDIVDWADAIIVHHFPERWIAGQWAAIRHKRVIWRTCGQSNPGLERQMGDLRGLGIVRYSPRERLAFEPSGFAGEDALIRFGKYPADYGPWIGDWPVVGNITQDMVGRGEAVGLDRWRRLTDGLPTRPAGPGSELLPGGDGPLDYPQMLDYLRHIRTYLYTGTIPASYTLGLIEAMLSGVPVVPHGWTIPDVHDWTSQAWLLKLWEAHDIVPFMDKFAGTDLLVREHLRLALDDVDWARERGEICRQRAIELFDVAHIGRRWLDFLGAPTRVTMSKATMG